jgi:hypothetical protein
MQVVTSSFRANEIFPYNPKIVTQPDLLASRPTREVTVDDDEGISNTPLCNKLVSPSDTVPVPRIMASLPSRSDTRGGNGSAVHRTGAPENTI